MTPYKLIPENQKKKKAFTGTISVFPLFSADFLICLKYRGGNMVKYVININLKC